jgi:hypothetical protein
MERTITVVLPVDEHEREARALAPGMAELDGKRIGAVDNGLGRSMTVVLEHTERALAAPLHERLPFDHLAPDFDEQQRSLGPFSKRVAGAITGLGN